MKVCIALSIAALFIAAPAHAQEGVVHADTVTFIKSEVVEVLSQETREIPGTNTTTLYQTIKAKLLEGPDAGQTNIVDNDYLQLSKGDQFYLRHTVNELDGIDMYSVSEPYRLPVLWFFIGLFLVCLFAFGGKQGARGLLALAGSVFFIVYLLVPGILNGYSPMLVSLGVSSLIIILGSYITHGFTKTTTTAVVGMLGTICITGALVYLAIHWGRLSGFTTEESVYLNFNTQGSIDFVGLLLGSMLIGLLGVLYDAAISQSIVVEELFAAEHLTKAQVYRRALRVGREHIGALVNTLAIAYVGASLPLILLFTINNLDPLLTLNQELFATELLRIIVGSIGLILAVPITTAVAVYALSRWPSSGMAHTHRH